MLARIGVLNLALIAAIVLALVLTAARQTPSRGIEIVRATPAAGVDALLVHVSGAVEAPGVVEAAPGERVATVIERAGGFAPHADQSAVNLARRVRDEDQIHVPLVGEGGAADRPEPRLGGRARGAAGIGPVYAGRIVEAREQLPFASSDELIERQIIPERTYEQIRDLVSTGPP